MGIREYSDRPKEQSMTNQKDVEELAQIIRDTFGVLTNMTVCRICANKMIKARFSKSPTLACLDENNVEQVLIDANLERNKLITEHKAIPLQFNYLAKAICSKFGSPPPISVVWPEKKEYLPNHQEARCTCNHCFATTMVNDMLEACKQAVKEAK